MLASLGGVCGGAYFHNNAQCAWWDPALYDHYACCPRSGCGALLAYDGGAPQTMLTCWSCKKPCLAADSTWLKAKLLTKAGTSWIPGGGPVLKIVDGIWSGNLWDVGGGVAGLAADIFTGGTSTFAKNAVDAATAIDIGVTLGEGYYLFCVADDLLASQALSD